jgi:Flp pilus assembly protein TadD
VLIALACVGTMAAYAVVRRAPPLPEPSRRFNRAVVTAAALAAIAGLAAADPVERFRDFKRPPTTLALPQRDFARAHLLSGNGSGRWQFWTAAAEEWKSRPLIGRGAGSYESWWARNGSLASFVQYAHSLYLEALAELGLVGFVLVLGAVGSGFVVIVRRVRATAGEERLTLAALGAVFAGFALSAAIDWVWQLPLVPMVAFACLGLVAGSERPTRRAAPVLLRAGVASAAVLLVCAQAVPLLVAVKLRESQRAVREGDGGRALTSALAATRIASWAASPYLQLALVQEQVGELGGARSSIGKALERSSQDWRLWLVAARLDTKTGHIAAARRSLRRAEQLDPRSPLFANAGG